MESCTWVLTLLATQLADDQKQNLKTLCASITLTASNSLNRLGMSNSFYIAGHIQLTLILSRSDQ